ncbi:MAG: ABC transporter permease [Dorea sp.]|nr:ABC transporter permease [Dorea sp.]MDY2812637.1 ABC transporter permease [Dorea sp.]
MAELNRDMFVIKGKDAKRMESISRPSLSFWQDAWRRLKKNRSAIVGLIIIVLYAVLAIFAPMFSKYTFSEMDIEAIHSLPSAAHWLGCDSTGRDQWVRIWMGARVSLSIGLISALVNMCVGAVIGGLCGYYGGKLDMIVMRIVDILYGIPSLIITILVMMVIGQGGVMPLIIALCIVGWIGTCRFVRGEVYRLKEQDFVMAAKVLGVPDFPIIIRHIIPNIMGMLITNLCMAIPGAIFQEAFLSYIGLGIKPPNCSWGILAKEGIQYLRTYPHEVIIPAFFICTTMLALNLLGNGLRDVVDPRLRGTD